MSTAVDDRYRRQLRLPGFGPDQQQALSAARIAVVGAGGLGSPVCEYLAAAGAGLETAGGQVTVIDADVVERSNLHRQVIHTDGAVGEPKTSSAAARMRAINPAVAVREMPQMLTAANALDLLGGHDVIIDGTDNFPTRYLASDAGEILGIPVVWGSILAWEGQLAVFDARPDAHGLAGVTYRDVHPVPPRAGEVPSCAEAGVLGMLCGVIGSAMAMQAVQVVCGIGEPLRGRLALFDALSFRWAELPVRRAPGRAPIAQLEDLTLTCGLPGPAVSDPAGDHGAGEVTALELESLRARGHRLIDIREAHELEAGMLEGAEHVPGAELLERVAQGDQTLGDLDGAVLYCASGRRSQAARAALAEHGVTVHSLAGGFQGLAGS